MILKNNNNNIKKTFEQLLPWFISSFPQISSFPIVINYSRIDHDSKKQQHQKDIYTTPSFLLDLFPRSHKFLLDF